MKQHLMESHIGPTLTDSQIEKYKGMMVSKGIPVRFLHNGQALDIISGELFSKGSNVIYHPMYWKFTKETAQEIADELGVKAVFSDEKESLQEELLSRRDLKYALDESWIDQHKKGVMSLSEEGKVLLQDEDDAAVEGDKTKIYTNEEGVQFWAEYDPTVEAWVCFQQVEGYPETEAWDDWFGSKDEAEDICKKLADGTL